MYKELVISIIIVVLIISLDVITQKYTDKAVEDTNEQLSQLRDKMQNDEDVDFFEDINKIYDKWMEYHDNLAYYIEHNELEKVETSFVQCKSYIENGEYDLAVAELDKTVFILEHISDKYSFNLENIF